MLFAKALNDLDWPIAFGLVCGRSLEKVAVASGTRLNAQALGSFTHKFAGVELFFVERALG
jgi:hypothetical protein